MVTSFWPTYSQHGLPASVLLLLGIAYGIGEGTHGQYTNQENSEVKRSVTTTKVCDNLPSECMIVVINNLVT